MVLTFLSCLFVNMEFGIILGAAFHLLLLLHLGNKPKISIGDLQAVSVIRSGPTESIGVVSPVQYFLPFFKKKNKQLI